MYRIFYRDYDGERKRVQTFPDYALLHDAKQLVSLLCFQIEVYNAEHRNEFLDVKTLEIIDTQGKVYCRREIGLVGTMGA